MAMRDCRARHVAAFGAMVLEMGLGAAKLERRIRAVPQQGERRNQGLALPHIRRQPAGQGAGSRPVAKIQRRIGGRAQGIGMPGAGRKRGVEPGQSLLEPIQMGERYRAIVQRITVVGFNCENSRVAGQSLLKALQRRQDSPLVVQGIDMARLEGKRPVVTFQCVFVAVKACQRNAAIDKRFDIVGLQG